MTAFIPYGAYWSTPFVRWQGAFSHLHAMKFAAHVTRQSLEQRGIDPQVFDYGAYGLTVPQKSSFFGFPWFASMVGAPDITGPTINQACATGTRLLASAAAEIMAGAATCALLVSGDRCSNGPHIVYPAPTAPGGTAEAENWVMDNFSSDPWAKCAMVDTAENVARRDKIDTAEQHELVVCRYEQYRMALENDSAFLKRFMTLPFDVPDTRFRKTLSTLTGDVGVTESTAEGLGKLKPVRPDGTVTFGSQTHPADGVAGAIMLDTAEHAAELSADPKIRIEVISFAQGREEAGYMPAAPIKAAKLALQRAGRTIEEMSAIKSHNPFAVNDIAFARAMNIKWQSMNDYGSSLIWGHPQGPTTLRSVIELIEQLAMRGGGYGLFEGCAAGDSAMALVIKVSDQQA